MAAAVVMAVVTGAYGAQLALAGTCTGKAPTKLAWSRAAGARRRACCAGPRRRGIRPAAYRVLRNGTVIGQTRRAPDRDPGDAAAQIRVHRAGGVSSTGVVSPCTASIERTIVIYHKPAAPKTLEAGRSHGRPRSRCNWPAGPGRRRPAWSATASCETVRSSGRPASRSYTLKNLFSSTTYTLTVRTVDTAGITSADSPRGDDPTLAPVPTTGTAHAFVLASTDRSFEDFQLALHAVSGWSTRPTTTAAGTARSSGTNDKLITSWAQARKVKVLPRINCQSATVLHAILTDPTRAARSIEPAESAGQCQRLRRPQHRLREWRGHRS